jgi:hypothetical protein
MKHVPPYRCPPPPGAEPVGPALDHCTITLQPEEAEALVTSSFWNGFLFALALVSLLVLGVYLTVPTAFAAGAFP